MLRRLITLGFPCLILFLVVLWFVTFREAKAQPQQNQVLDFTIKFCSDFSVAESHLQAAFHTVTKGYKSIPGQKEQEFMAWYANGGAIEMFHTGGMCRLKMSMKSGEIESLKAGLFIAEETAQNAEFFADKLLKQRTGKSLYKR